MNLLLVLIYKVQLKGKTAWIQNVRENILKLLEYAHIFVPFKIAHCYRFYGMGRNLPWLAASLNYAFAVCFVHKTFKLKLYIKFKSIKHNHFALIFFEYLYISGDSAVFWLKPEVNSIILMIEILRAQLLSHFIKPNFAGSYSKACHSIQIGPANINYQNYSTDLCLPMPCVNCTQPNCHKIAILLTLRANSAEMTVFYKGNSSISKFNYFYHSHGPLAFI